MKIVHVVSGYLPQDSGGTQMHLRDLCAAQRAAGHETAIFSRLGGDEFAEFEVTSAEWEGVPVTRITNNFQDVDDLQLLFHHPRIDAAFGDYLDIEKPDIVHVHHLTCLSTTIIDVAKDRGLPVVMTLHDYWMICPRGQRIHPDDLRICDPLDRKRCLPCLQSLWPHLLPKGRPASLWQRLFGKNPSAEKLVLWEAEIRRVLDRCDLTISPSRFHRDRFVEWGLDAKRSVAIEHGLPREELLAEPRGRKEIERIGFIGTVIPSKGIHTLVEAFSRLGREDLSLEIHGEIPSFHGEDSYRARLEALVKPSMQVHFHGRYEHRDLARILGGLDVVVVPSLWWESFCLTAREAALAGACVVGCRLGGVGEAVEDGLALGFDAGDPRDLASKLRSLIEDVDLRDAYSRKADLVRDMEDCAEETTSFYESVLRKAAAAQSGEGMQ